MILTIRKNHFSYLSGGNLLIYWNVNIHNTKIYLQLNVPENIKKRDGHKICIIFFRYCYIGIETIPGMGAKMIRAAGTSAIP